MLYSTSSGAQLLLAIINVTATLSARVHIGNFWRGKAKVPFVSGFNEAITRTEVIRQQLLYLAGSWVFTGLLSLGLYMTTVK